MIRVAVLGAAGRMGRALVQAIVNDSETALSGATEVAGNDLLGQDAGVVAGVGAQGVALTDCLASVLSPSDAVIDFTSPDVTVANARAAVEAGCSIVVGTTGLTSDQRRELEGLAGTGRIVLAPNMSVGVNLLFHLCDQVTRILGEEYDIEVTEMHHNRKKDAPSGTAVRLGEVLAAARGLDPERDIRHGRVGAVGARPHGEIGMHALRGGDVVGEHTVLFATDGERVELTHKASTRETFTRGAVRAVKFLADHPASLYDMQDVLGLR